MDSFSEIIGAFGGPAAFSEALGITPNHAGVMKARDAIPAEYWESLVSAASDKGIGGITFETLARIAAKKRTGAAA